ncbi:MAG: DNA-processing protein DprA [Bosea sp. (in: a-proteobacteria)]
MAKLALTDQQRLDWLRLIRTDSIGPRTFRALLNRFGGAAAALEALPEVSRAAGKPVHPVSLADAEREMAAAHCAGVRFMALGEADYPSALQAIDSAPPLLGVRGNASVLNRPSAAIVGSRNASVAGLKFTRILARDLGEAGFIVVSGLARGIDTAAHDASVKSGTIAVLAGGQDQIYPSENIGLLESILENGCALSEMPMGWQPRGRDFPRRNRLVSGLSLGVVVVEAARKSGSLITARFALEQGRDVFAVPGSPLDPRAEGCNDLIRQGASLCGNSAHVIEALLPLAEAPDLLSVLAPGRLDESGRETDRTDMLWDELDLPDVVAAPQTPRADLYEAEASPVEPLRGAQSAGVSQAEAVLLELLGPTAVAVDDLVRACGLPVREVNLALLDLELSGKIMRHGGNAVSRPA